MSQYSFGSGALWGTPLQDAAGNAISNPTPLLFGTLQDISIDMSFETKTLHGQNQFPVAVGRGKGKITGKAKFAQISGAMFNSLFFGQTMASGLVTANYDTTGVLIPALSPYTVTVTPANSGVWSQDLGVIDTNGLPLTRVAASPAAGQYTVAAGVYTFAAADTGKKVYVNYQYTATSTTARKSTVQNIPMGYAPTFRADFSVSYQGKSLTMSLPSCIASKLGFGAKNDNFSVPEFDFEAFADSAGNVLTWSTAE